MVQWAKLSKKHNSTSYIWQLWCEPIIHQCLTSPQMHIDKSNFKHCSIGITWTMGVGGGEKETDEDRGWDKREREAILSAAVLLSSAQDMTLIVPHLNQSLFPTSCHQHLCASTKGNTSLWGWRGAPRPFCLFFPAHASYLILFFFCLDDSAAQPLPTKRTRPGSQMGNQ